MMTVLPRTPYQSLTTSFTCSVSGTATARVVGMRLKPGGNAVGEVGNQRGNGAVGGDAESPAGKIASLGKAHRQIQDDERQDASTPSGSVHLGPGIGVNWPEFVFSIPDVWTFKTSTDAAQGLIYVVYTTLD
jgi:hypothetical protein